MGYTCHCSTCTCTCTCTDMTTYLRNGETQDEHGKGLKLLHQYAATRTKKESHQSTPPHPLLNCHHPLRTHTASTVLPPKIRGGHSSTQHKQVRCAILSRQNRRWRRYTKLNRHRSVRRNLPIEKNRTARLFIKYLLNHSPSRRASPPQRAFLQVNISQINLSPTSQTRFPNKARTSKRTTLPSYR